MSRRVSVYGRKGAARAERHYHEAREWTAFAAEAGPDAEAGGGEGGEGGAGALLAPPGDAGPLRPRSRSAPRARSPPARGRPRVSDPEPINAKRAGKPRGRSARGRRPALDFGSDGGQHTEPEEVVLDAADDGAPDDGGPDGDKENDIVLELDIPAAQAPPKDIFDVPLSSPEDAEPVDSSASAPAPAPASAKAAAKPLRALGALRPSLGRQPADRKPAPNPAPKNAPKQAPKPSTKAPPKQAAKPAAARRIPLQFVPNPASRVGPAPDPPSSDSSAFPDGNSDKENVAPTGRFLPSQFPPLDSSSLSESSFGFDPAEVIRGSNAHEYASPRSRSPSPSALAIPGAQAAADDDDVGDLDSPTVLVSPPRGAWKKLTPGPGPTREAAEVDFEMSGRPQGGTQSPSQGRVGRGWMSPGLSPVS
ncbi:hypothetical protein DFJ74DRAFT_704704 [Hyaloraphidium curvatum]|nr:hypothetical protein DFJ74DRAFT_704704 [Hyaloraphidium curvatum]